MTALYPGGQNLKKREGITVAQRSLLEDIRTAGVKTYNGRAARMITELEQRDLVHAEWELILHGGAHATWSITVHVALTNFDCAKCDVSWTARQNGEKS